MRKWAIWGLAGVAGVIVLAIGIGLLTGLIGFHVGECLTDDESEASVLNPFKDEALRFVDAIMRADIDAAYADMTDEAKQKTSLDQFHAAARTLRTAMPDLSEVHVAHVYYLKGITTGATQAVPCTALAHGSMTNPEDRVVAAAGPVSQQAHVIVEGRSNGQSWAFALWLTGDQRTERVRSFWAEETSIAGKTVSDIWSMARTQRDRAHNFNAAILYDSAKQLSFRGPNFQLGIYATIVGELGQLSLPAELQGKPPFNWQFGSDSYRVLGVAPATIDGKLGVAIRHEAPAIVDGEDADATNHRFIKDFEAAQQDLADAFEAVLVDMVYAGGQRHFLTREVLQKGT